MNVPKLFKFAPNGLAVLLIVLAFLWTLIVDTAPTNEINWQPNVFLARELFKKTADAAQHNQDLTFNQVELNHAVNSTLNRYIRSIAKITFKANNTADFEVSLQLPKYLSNYYINFRFEITNRANSLNVSNLSINHLPINHTITDLLINYTLEHSVLKHYFLLAMEHIQSIQIREQQLVIRYQINTLTTHYNAATNNIDANVLSFYQQQIEQIVSKHNPSQRLSLAELMQPLFKQAYQRSTLQSAINENIAIIFVIAAYVNSNEIPFYLPIKALQFSVNTYPVFLYKRSDQAKHFMLSAALTSTGGAQLADVLGQEKELRDAQSSSGFSFIDLAADRAGMKFSEQALRSPQDARALQKTMSEIKDYASFMPNVQDLPEKLTQAKFTQQYDSINSKAYKDQIQMIDNRIEALAIYPKH
jgi:hypothetical protein